MKTNYVLIDLENVTPESIHVLSADHFQVRVFVGENQKRISTEVVTAVQRLGDKAQYVQICGHGPNALDFHIAYYIGRLSLETPGAFFHIISGDKGFDPLLKHLKEQKVFCLRHESLAQIPLVRHMNSSLAEKVEAVVEKLLNKPARPKTSAALRRHVNAVFAKALTESQLDDVVKELCRRGLVKEVDGKISYPDATSGHAEIGTGATAPAESPAVV